MLSTSEMQERLKDSSVSSVAKNSGVAYATVSKAKRGKLKMAKTSDYEKLSDYLERKLNGIA
ncbi:MAG: hypothetical protein ACYC4K_09725 [Thiobacillus sp.]